MYKSLICVIFAGATIGLMVPTGHGSNAAPGPSPSGARPAPVETRVERSPFGHFYVNANVNGQLVHFVVDTGATMVALTPQDAERVGLKVDPSSFEVVGQGAAGEVRGAHVTLRSVELDGKEVNDVRGAILEGSDISLLGQSYLSHFNIQMNGDTMVLR